MLPIAIQLYSVRDEMESDFEGTLKKIKAFGYDGVEFAGLFGNSPQKIRDLLKQIGLIPISAHISIDEMLGNPQKVFEDYAYIGCSYAAVPCLNEQYHPGNPGFFDVIDSIKMLGAVANEKGITLLYHNHDFEFKKIDGEYGLDVLFSSISSDLLQTEIDTCWVNVAGENPISYIQKYSNRAPIVHLKDFVGNTEIQQFEQRPLGLGCQDFPGIINACEKAKTQWLVVEQDSPSMNKTSMECAKMSLEYLKSLNK